MKCSYIKSFSEEGLNIDNIFRAKLIINNN